MRYEIPPLTIILDMSFILLSVRKSSINSVDSTVSS
jgi:hypothetical protein